MLQNEFLRAAEDVSNTGDLVPRNAKHLTSIGLTPGEADAALYRAANAVYMGNAFDRFLEAAAAKQSIRCGRGFSGAHGVLIRYIETDKQGRWDFIREINLAAADVLKEKAERLLSVAQSFRESAVPAVRDRWVVAHVAK